MRPPWDFHRTTRPPRHSGGDWLIVAAVAVMVMAIVVFAMWQLGEKV